jgi:hypothetical protein
VLQVFEVDGTLDDCLAMSAIARAFAELKPWRLSWSGAMNTRSWIGKCARAVGVIRRRSSSIGGEAVE